MIPYSGSMETELLYYNSTVKTLIRDCESPPINQSVQKMFFQLLKIWKLDTLLQLPLLKTL